MLKSKKLLDVICLPDTWTIQSEVIQAPITKGSAEYNKVTSFLSGNSLHNLQKIVKIWNPYLYGRYMLRKKEYGETNFMEK